MLKLCILVFLLLPCNVLASWTLEQSGDGHWIRNKTPEQHELVVVEDASGIHFLLILSISGRTLISENLEVSLQIDRNKPMPTQIMPLQQRTHGIAFRIELNESDKSITKARMVAGLTLKFRFGETTGIKDELEFSLIGFTDAYTDMQIAHEVGKLDPDWLDAQGKSLEADCYHNAKITILAMQARRQWKSSRQFLDNIPVTGFSSSSTDRDIVSRVYQMPRKTLPRHPMAEKYRLFKRCMTDT